MASKYLSLLCVIVLLLCNRPAAYAARPSPIQNQGLEAEETETEMVEENCGGVGEEDCLIRRTLAAHIDYVYTQKHKP